MIKTYIRPNAQLILSIFFGNYISSKLDNDSRSEKFFHTLLNPTGSSVLNVNVAEYMYY